MSRERLADAYEEQAALLTRLAEVTAQISHELRGIETPAAGSVPPSPVSASVAAAPVSAVAAATCPAHGKAKPRKNGTLYCPTPVKKRGDEVLEWCDWVAAA